MALSSNTATVSITLAPVNDAPSCIDGFLIVTEGVSTSGSLASLCTDVDSGDTLSYGKLSDPANGTVVVNPDGSYTYTPNSDYIGSDSFTFQTIDSLGVNSNVVTLAIAVGPVDIDSSVPSSQDRVDGYDLLALALAFGSDPSQSNWNPAADLNGDGVVDGEDLLILSIHFGEIQQ